MDYRNILPLVSHTQEFSTDYWNDFGYWNDGTFWYEKTPTYTARVTAYAAATGITDYTILDPLNIFDLGLTYYGLDTIMKAIYPMVTDKTSQSDMANQMKYNFMNPLDTNAAFRLQWFGGWIYSRTGALPNGTNAYADTKLVPSTASSLSSFHHSVYSRTLYNASSGIMGGCNTPEIPNRYLIISNLSATGLSNNIFNTGPNQFNATINNTRGLMMGNRISNTIVNAFKDGVKVLNNTSNTVTERPTINYYIGARNNSDGVTIAPSNYDNKEYAFYSIGDGLTDSQAQIFSSLVNNLQKALNRAVY